MKIQHLILIAYRYLKGAKEESSIRTMVKICSIGITLGTFSLALVISIMRGFEKSTHEQLQGMNAQIILDGSGQEINYKKIKPILETEFKNTIKAFTPSSSESVIIEQYDNQPFVALLKGIDPTSASEVTIISKKITTPKKFKFQDLLEEDKVIVGAKFAKQNDLICGSKINFYFVPDEISSYKKIALDSYKVKIGGIFQTGIDEYDTGVIMCSLKLLNKMFPNNGIATIEMKLQPKAKEDDVIKALKKRFNLTAYSWKSLYPALVAALKLEKYAMFFILALITLVASMSMISLLFMLITHKKRDIAILSSMGLEKKYISLIFIIIGQTIAILSAILGLFLAFCTCIFFKKYPFIKLPDIYYVTHLPVAIEWQLFLSVFIVVLVLSLFASWIPTQKIQKISISNVLRFER